MPTTSHALPPRQRSAHGSAGDAAWGSVCDWGQAWGSEERQPLMRLGRIYLAGRNDAMFAPGGGETQLLKTAQALRDLGLDARLWRPWEDRLQPGDWLHLFGSCPEFAPVAAAARQQGVQVAVSTIAWFSARALWHEAANLRQGIARVARFAVRAACPAIPSWRRRLYHLADRLLPNSQAEAQQLCRYFDVPRDKIAVVPNAADLRFADAAADAFQRQFGLRDFVLYAGRIEPRKNQLAFLQAMHGSALPMVVLGDAVPGHQAYYHRCRAEAGPNVTFLPRLPHDGQLLASCYAACRCLVLTSLFETPGLVALEAAAQGVPLVLTDRGCTREYFGEHARYVSPFDRVAIRSAVEAAAASPRCARRAAHVARHFSWQAAARATAAAYLASTQSAFAEKDAACSRNPSGEDFGAALDPIPRDSACGLAGCWDATGT